uniref:Uncharacterized protein n=1 Tax=Romanomermis culicivorax TaxID=13658 RepID=A0A915KEY5_ROMCU
METMVEVLDMDKHNYINELHSAFHLYLRLLGHINFLNTLSFPVPVYAYPLLTTALVQLVTNEELLDQLILASSHEPSDDELMETPIFDLNIAKLLPDITSSWTSLASASDLIASALRINEFLKLALKDIANIAPARMELTMPEREQLDTAIEEVVMNVSYKMLTKIPGETTTDVAIRYQALH